MKKKTFCLLWPVASLLLAVLCGVVRIWQLSSAFEGVYALPVAGAPASVVLVMLFIIAAAVLLLLAINQPVPRQPCHHLADAKGDNLIFSAMVVSAVLALAAVPFLFRESAKLHQLYQTMKAYNGNIPGGNSGLLPLITALTSLLTFVGLLVSGRAAYKGSSSGRLAILFPVINNCLWLMASYRGYAPDPVRWRYAPLLIAIALGTWAYLEWAGLSTNSAHPRRALWTAGMAVVFSLAVIPGVESKSALFLLCTQAIAALALLLLAPKNMFRLPEPAKQPAPAEEEVEEDTNE